MSYICLIYVLHMSYICLIYVLHMSYICPMYVLHMSYSSVSFSSPLGEDITSILHVKN